MGAWGTSISSNDTFADVYGDFFELYNDGLETVEISERLIKTNKEVIDDPDDCNNFWFALAKAQWECKQLDTELFNNVKNIIQSGADIKVWRELGADSGDLKKRQLALNKFLSDISVEKLRAKARKKKKQFKIVQPVFEKGDCLTFKLYNGNYGGAVVLEAIYDQVNPLVNLVAATRINQSEKPALKDFEKAEVLIQNFANWKDSPNIHWYNPIKHSDIEPFIELVGKVKIDREFPLDIHTYSQYGSCADFDIWIIEQSSKQFLFEVQNKKPGIRIYLKDLIKINKWKFW